jgi:hypothetical protein
VKINITVNVDGRKDDARRRKPKLLWVIGPISEQPMFRTSRSQKNIMLKLTNTQQAALSIAPVDRKGKPAQVDAIVFTSSDDTVATVTQDPDDPRKALLKAVETGTAQINVTADADLGDGVLELTGTLDVTVVAGQAVSLAIQTGTVEEQP